MESWSIDRELQAYRIVPPHPSAAVLILHGYGEHAGRHERTMQAFARRGIAAYAYDHRGHGRSPGRRAFVERFDQLVDDSLIVRSKVARIHGGVPLLLFGASMGGVVAVRSVQRDAAGLAGVVLVAPALGVGHDAAPFVRVLGTLASALVPWVPIGDLDLELLSRDEGVRLNYANDPLAHHGGIPARTAIELVAAAAAAIGAASAWQAPLLIVHGDADRIAPLDGSRRFFDAARGADVTLRVVPGAYHEPLGEADGDALIDEIAAWMLARRPPEPASELAAGVIAPIAVRHYSWWEGLAFGAAVNVAARLLGTNAGRYEALRRPAFAPPGWVFPIAWGVNSALAIWGNLRVLNAPPSTDRSAYLRLWALTWLLYCSFGYAFFRRKSPLLGLLVTTNFFVLAIVSAGRAVRIDRRLWLSYATLLPWLALASAVAGSVALTNPDPLLDDDARDE